jgi:tRNA-specific 2-thiouridylase
MSDPAGAAGSARRAAEVLGIPHFVADVSDAFEELVLGPARRAWASGLTPNPCALCNRALKLGLLPRIGAGICGERFDLIATGHHARLETGPGGRVRLLRAMDRGKDQSYFLGLVDRGVLGSTAFPVGGTAKDEVRRMAVEAGLGEQAARPESQDFAGLQARTAMLEGSAEPGPVVDRAGRRIGTHGGAALYTVGQRHGLGTGGGAAHYVLEVDAHSNTIVAGPRESLLSSCACASGMNWLAFGEPPGEFRATARIRSAHRGAACTARVRDAGRSVSVAFDSPQEAVTPGQVLALYDGDELLGAGVLDRP